MTQQNPTFNPSEFELRPYYSAPYLTAAQSAAVSQVEERVNGELDFVAQMLGWSGDNYWANLTNTVNEKRQLLGGTYGVYNSFIVPRIYEIRNWNNTIVIDPLPRVDPNRSNYSEYVLVGQDKYEIQSIELEGDRFVVSLGVLPQSFYDQVAANVPVRVSVPQQRPAPFYRPNVGASGDNGFFCDAPDPGTSLVLYPLFDTQKKFPYRFPILFAGSTYYFSQPIFLSYTSSISEDVVPEYDANIQLWVLSIPETLTIPQTGLTAYLVWAYANRTTPTNAILEISVQQWVDPSDWTSQKVLENFRGAWNNKGGALPFNLVFDTLSIHGFNEENSLYFPGMQRTLDFNTLVNKVFYQQTVIGSLAPGVASAGDIWWNDDTGVLSTLLPSADGCSQWVEIDYRTTPDVFVYGDLVYTTVPAFLAAISAIPIGTQVTILDVTGLTVADNVLGVQGTLTTPGTLTLYRANSNQPYWTPVQFLYANETDFAADSQLLPYKVPVLLADSTGLSPSGSGYAVENLKQQILGDYAVTLTKYYNNRTWTISPDSLLKYIANTALFGSPLQGQMWWDYAVPTPELRSAAIYYQSAWVGVNTVAPSVPPAPSLNPAVLNFYADGQILSVGTTYATDDYLLTLTVDGANGDYTFNYVPKTLRGKTQLPTITVSDNLSTVYQADITVDVFSGVTYIMSPNVYDAETPLRLWKSQDLQDAETLAHLAEDNFINPLLADLNCGPGAENWERYFVRLPLDYARNQIFWQKTVLACQDFGYWGSGVELEQMRCPPEDDTPAIYEELFLYDQAIKDYTYVYCEPYLYSNLAYTYAPEPGDYRNAAVFPATDEQFDEFSEAELIDYDPLHSRLVNLSKPTGEGYGNWVGEYVNINPCVSLTGFFTTDLENNNLEPVAAPVWDASIYKFAPTCQNAKETYNVDANHYKIGYAYFVADASAAEDGFFDVSQEAAWRTPSPESQSLYLLPR